MNIALFNSNSSLSPIIEALILTVHAKRENCYPPDESRTLEESGIFDSQLKSTYTKSTYRLDFVWNITYPEKGYDKPRILESITWEM